MHAFTHIFHIAYVLMEGLQIQIKYLFIQQKKEQLKLLKLNKTETVKE